VLGARPALRLVTEPSRAPTHRLAREATWVLLRPVRSGPPTGRRFNLPGCADVRLAFCGHAKDKPPRSSPRGRGQPVRQSGNATVRYPAFSIALAARAAVTTRKPHPLRRRLDATASGWTVRGRGPVIGDCRRHPSR